MNTSNLSTIVSPSILINGNDYIQYAQIGMVIKETLTEELDSATLILNNVTRTLFEAFDEVVITLENNKKYYMYVNTSSEAIFNYEAHTYSYTLQLISQTKILERIILPNLKIRHSLNGRKNTIQWYVEKVVLPYITRQVSGITMSLRFSSFTAKYDCPEIEWNHPTAKQVLNDLLGTISNNPSLIKIANHKLDYVNLAREGIDCSSKLTHIVQDEQFEQMQDFANNITMDVQNAIPKDANCRAIVSPRAEGNTLYLTL